MRHLRLPNLITRADIPTAIFGGWDGCISVLAVMVGLAASGHTSGAIIAGICGAVGGTFSMATGQYVSYPPDTPTSTAIRGAVVMGATTGIGGMIPVAPFLIGGNRWADLAAALALALAFATGVAVTKARTAGRRLRAADLALDYGLLLVTAAATTAIGFL